MDADKYRTANMVEGATQIGFMKPNATGRPMTGQEVLDKYGIDAFAEIFDKGTFVKPEADWWPKGWNWRDEA